MVLGPVKVMRAKRRPTGFVLASVAAAALCSGAIISTAQAQTNENGWVLDLPRRGYEPRLVHIGPFKADISADAGARYNSNIFATPDNEVDDYVFELGSALTAEAEYRNITIGVGAYGTFQRYFDNQQENRETYGVEGSAELELSRSQSASVRLFYDHSFERRDDPEANDFATDPLTEIDIVGADFQYQYRPGRIGFVVNAGVTELDYLRIEDDDRDLKTLRVSGRALAAVSSDIDIFVEGYGVFRDMRLAVDRNGFNRDSTTLGTRAGVALDFTEKLIGEIGVGVFDADFDDPLLDDFSGVSAFGRLRWSPQERTGVILNVFRGNVATIRNGASGRVDLRLGLEVIQEVYHNINLRGSVTYRDGLFRTSDQQKEKDFTTRIGAEYLLNRTASLEANYQFRNRDSTRDTDDFDSHMLGLSLKLRY